HLTRFTLFPTRRSSDLKNRLNYEIEIPDNKNFFNVFHISLLEPAPKDVRLTTTIQPNIISPDDDNDDDQEWEIQKILDSRYNDRSEEHTSELQSPDHLV